MTKRLPERRTGVVTAAGIAAVIVAGAFAVGANMGILDASSDNEIGGLSAAGDLVPVSPSTTASTTTAVARTFFVDVAGTVTLDASGASLVVSAVDAAPGWTWTAGVPGSSDVELAFTDGARLLVFRATRGLDGSIAAQVDEIAPGASDEATAPAVSGDDDDDHERDLHDAAERDDEHEGRDDDD